MLGESLKSSITALLCRRGISNTAFSLRLVLALFKLSLLLTSLFTLIACSLLPTRVYESSDSHFHQLVKSTEKKLVLDKETIVIDARLHFKYSLSNIPQSKNLQWSDFSYKKSGVLKKDLSHEVRRLALYGIDPKTKVIVVGEGKNAKGEEGRLAWTLLYLGIHNVQFVSIDYFKSARKVVKGEEAPPQKNKNKWKPEFKKSLLVSDEEIKITIVRPYLKRKSFIIDVRSHEEYFSKKSFGGKYKYPDINAIHIHWKEFLDKDGRPSARIKKQLQEMKISEKSRVIVISNKGLRSGTVTAALYAMGFKNVGNYPGGYVELFKK